MWRPFHLKVEWKNKFLEFWYVSVIFLGRILFLVSIPKDLTMVSRTVVRGLLFNHSVLPPSNWGGFSIWSRIFLRGVKSWPKLRGVKGWGGLSWFEGGLEKFFKNKINFFSKKFLSASKYFNEKKSQFFLSIFKKKFSPNFS